MDPNAQLADWWWAYEAMKAHHNATNAIRERDEASKLIRWLNRGGFPPAHLDAPLRAAWEVFQTRYRWDLL